MVELPLLNSKMDGMASLTTGVPVIGLSTRGDRMDGFVFTLLHEIAHLVLGHVSADRLSHRRGSGPERQLRERTCHERCGCLVDL